MWTKRSQGVVIKCTREFKFTKAQAAQFLIPDCHCRFWADLSQSSVRSRAILKGVSAFTEWRPFLSNRNVCPAETSYVFPS